MPAYSKDKAGYKTAHGARTTVLIGLADKLRCSGTLLVMSGALSRKSRDLDVVVRQVTDDD